MAGARPPTQGTRPRQPRERGSSRSRQCGNDVRRRVVRNARVRVPPDRVAGRSARPEPTASTTSGASRPRTVSQLTRRSPIGGSPGRALFRAGVGTARAPHRAARYQGDHPAFRVRFGTGTTTIMAWRAGGRHRGSLARERAGAVRWGVGVSANPADGHHCATLSSGCTNKPDATGGCRADCDVRQLFTDRTSVLLRRINLPGGVLQRQQRPYPAAGRRGTWNPERG